MARDVAEPMYRLNRRLNLPYLAERLHHVGVRTPPNPKKWLRLRAVRAAKNDLAEERSKSPNIILAVLEVDFLPAEDERIIKAVIPTSSR